jgi:hypothetical protein
MQSNRMLLVLALAAASPAHGQQGTAAADPAAAAPVITYDSAFATYRPYRDEPLRSWADVNQEVAAGGGHAGIFGGAGDGTHTAPKAPAEAPLGQGRPPVRAAPKAPAEKHRQ